MLLLLQLLCVILLCSKHCSALQRVVVLEPFVAVSKLLLFSVLLYVLTLTISNYFMNIHSTKITIMLIYNSLIITAVEITVIIILIVIVTADIPVVPDMNVF
jgi:hypothetical protein